MSSMHNGNTQQPSEGNEDDLEQILLQGVHLSAPSPALPTEASPTANDDDLDVESRFDNDIQGSLALFAEASQDMATATVELSLGRHFACVDFCNQAVEKAAQAVSLRRFGRRSMYNHDLRALGTLVGAPVAIQDEMDKLTPFHPETFYAETPPEEADEVINAEQASRYIQAARTVLRWAKSIVLK